jgi:hypothetical protein
MLTRCGFFQGHVVEGEEAAFDRFIEQRLMPLWRKFPGVTDVRLLRRVEADPNAPTIHMALEFDYPSREALESTLVSAERARAKAETAELMKMFEGQIFHIIFER